MNGIGDDIILKWQLEILKYMGDEITEWERMEVTKINHVIEDNAGPIYGEVREDRIEEKRDFVCGESLGWRFREDIGG